MTTTERDRGPTPGAKARSVTAGNREAARHGVTNTHEMAAERGMAGRSVAVTGSELVGGSLVGGSEVVARVGVASERGRAMDGGRGAVASVLGRVEGAFIRLAGRFGVPALRITLALTFLWFGVLKITNDTPVGGFVASTVDWIPGVSGSWFVPFLGVVEVLLGAALLVGRGLRVVLPLLFAHLAGTFLALVTQPEVTFQGGNPVMLTTEGEFVVKNLILLSAVLVLYGLQRARVARS